MEYPGWPAADGEEGSASSWAAYPQAAQALYSQMYAAQMYSQMYPAADSSSEEASSEEDKKDKKKKEKRKKEKKEKRDKKEKKKKHKDREHKSKTAKKSPDKDSDGKSGTEKEGTPETGAEPAKPVTAAAVAIGRLGGPAHRTVNATGEEVGSFGTFGAASPKRDDRPTPGQMVAEVHRRVSRFDQTEDELAERMANLNSPEKEAKPHGETIGATVQTPVGWRTRQAELDPLPPDSPQKKKKQRAGRKKKPPVEEVAIETTEGIEEAENPIKLEAVQNFKPPKRWRKFSKAKVDHKEWITDEMKECLDKRNSFMMKARHSGNMILWDKFKKLRNAINKLLIRHKQLYLTQLENEMAEGEVKFVLCAKDKKKLEKDTDPAHFREICGQKVPNVLEQSSVVVIGKRKFGEKAVPVNKEEHKSLTQATVKLKEDFEVAIDQYKTGGQRQTSDGDVAQVRRPPETSLRNKFPETGGIDLSKRYTDMDRPADEADALSFDTLLDIVKSGPVVVSSAPAAASASLPQTSFVSRPDAEASRKRPGTPETGIADSSYAKKTSRIEQPVGAIPGESPVELLERLKKSAAAQQEQIRIQATAPAAAPGLDTNQLLRTIASLQQQVTEMSSQMENQQRPAAMNMMGMPPPLGMPPPPLNMPPPGYPQYHGFPGFPMPGYPPHYGAPPPTTTQSQQQNQQDGRGGNLLSLV